MEFFGRKEELATLQQLWKQASRESKMVALTGRRRIGKTLLALQFARSHPSIYLFVEKKAEALLCKEFVETIAAKFPLPVIGEITRFKDILCLLFEIGKKEKITVIIDEFQEFQFINHAVFSECQHLWDLYKKESRLCLILVGSVFSLMKKIFQDDKEPLFGRADRILHIAPFSIPTIAALLKKNRISNIKVLFDCYVITGGMPKYLDLLVTNHAIGLKKAVNFIFSDFSPFLEEGKYVLIEEFGKEYGIYFSILELIAMGKTSRSEIESIIGFNVGGFLDRLEQDYSVISRIRPFGEKPASRSVKYYIQDNFLNFWFRYIYRHRQALEAKNFDYAKEIFMRDYPIYAGRLLEKFFRELIAGSKAYNKIGNYWEKGNQNEIDIVAVNDLKKTLLLGEVKLNPKKLNLYELEQKAVSLVSHYKNYKTLYKGFSLEDAKKILKW